MDVQVNDQRVVVEEVVGNVVVVSADGSSRLLAVGDTIEPGVVIITPEGGSLLLSQGQNSNPVDANSVATVNDGDVAAAAVNGVVEVNPSAPTNFTGDDVAALQQAILDGVDLRRRLRQLRQVRLVVMQLMLVSLLLHMLMLKQ
ncbi:RTX toxins and related Ca2+-binding proteins [Vibrio astriarenae]|nr:RTX toxins and related Ca2+-binding proteins [Vibrio sp. C7]